ncbi:MAG: glycosyltransferase family 2 protein [bacterium]|nr:glycosyltransferase family 2 protein [bacterium]
MSSSIKPKNHFGFDNLIIHNILSVMTNVSIIIVTWNSEEYIESCLNSIDKSYEIILVDNDSKDSTLQKVKTKFPYVKIIKNPTNHGLSKATNRGAEIATHDYLLLLNPDVILKKDTVEKLCSFMNSHKDSAICGPQFFYPNGKLQPSCRELPTFKNLFFEASGLGKFHGWKMRYFDHKATREVEQIMASCLLIKKSVFNEVGGMNERYPIFMNDVDLCYNVKEQGYKIYFCADTNVIHYHGASTRKMGRKKIIEWHWSMYRYLKDHSQNTFLIIIYGTLLLGGAVLRVLFELLFSWTRTIFSKTKKA